MTTELVMLIPEDSPGAGLVMRRSDGQFTCGRIDARVARAARAAAVLAALETLAREEEEKASAPRLIEFKTV